MSFRVFDRLHDVRRHHDAVIGECRRRVRQLQDGEGVVALTDTDRGCIARIPGLAEAPLFPLRRRQDAGAFVLQVDAGELTEAPWFHKVVDRIDAHLIGELVIVRVARDDDRLAQVDGSLAAGTRIAEAMVAQLEVSRVEDRVRRRARTARERRQRHEGLVGRSGRIGAAQRAVQQRVVGVFVEPLPGLGIDAVDEHIGVETGARDERQHRAGCRFDRHQRAAPVAVQGFGQLLQAGIDRQDQVGAWHRRRARQGAHDPSARRDLDLVGADQAVQGLLVRLFNAGFSDVGRTGIAGQQILVVQPFEILFRDPSDVPEQMRRRVAQRVAAKRTCADLDAREAVTLNRKACNFLIAQPGLECHAFRTAGIAQQPPEAHPLAFGDLDDAPERIDGPVEIRDRGGAQFERVGGDVFRQQDAVAIEDQTAGWRRGNQCDAVVFGLGAKRCVAVDLQPPEAHAEQAEAHEDDEHGHGQSRPQALQIPFRIAHLGHERRPSCAGCSPCRDDRAGIRSGDSRHDRRRAAAVRAVRHWPAATTACS